MSESTTDPKDRDFPLENRVREAAQLILRYPHGHTLGRAALTALGVDKKIVDAAYWVAIDMANKEAAKAQAEKANREAVFYPQTDDKYERPTIGIAGAYVAVYVDPERVLRVGIDLDEVARWMCRDEGEGTVPLHITVGGETVFQA